MSSLKQIISYCKEPNLKNFQTMKEKYKVLYGYSSKLILDLLDGDENKVKKGLDCLLFLNDERLEVFLPESKVKKLKEKIDFIKKTYLFYITRNLSFDSKRGLRACIVACRFLDTLPCEETYPKIDIYTTDLTNIENVDISIHLNKSSFSSGNFYIIDVLSDNIGIKSEKALLFEDLKFNLLEIFSQKENIEKDVKIKKIYFRFKDGNRKIFYDYTKGLVWGNEKCIDCADRYLNRKLTEKDDDYDECMNLIENSCEEKIRYRPGSNFEITIDKDVKQNDDNDNDKVEKQKTWLEILNEKKTNWQCKRCKLENTNSSSSCTSCGLGKNDEYDEKTSFIENIEFLQKTLSDMYKSIQKDTIKLKNLKAKSDDKKIENLKQKLKADNEEFNTKEKELKDTNTRFFTQYRKEFIKYFLNKKDDNIKKYTNVKNIPVDGTSEMISVRKVRNGYQIVKVYDNDTERFIASIDSEPLKCEVVEKNLRITFKEKNKKGNNLVSVFSDWDDDRYFGNIIDFGFESVE
jgi:hypothetical protein